jgi:hypothetical protein
VEDKREWVVQGKIGKERFKEREREREERE